MTRKPINGNRFKKHLVSDIKESLPFSFIEFKAEYVGYHVSAGRHFLYDNILYNIVDVAEYLESDTVELTLDRLIAYKK